MDRNARSDRAAIKIRQIGPFRRVVPDREQVALPRLLLVPRDSQLPDAVSTAMRAGEGEGTKLRLGGAFLGVHGFPEFVLVAPGADQQEVEIAATAVQHGETQAAGDFRRLLQALTLQERTGEA